MTLAPASRARSDRALKMSVISGAFRIVSPRSNIEAPFVVPENVESPCALLADLGLGNECGPMNPSTRSKVATLLYSALLEARSASTHTDYKLAFPPHIGTATKVNTSEYDAFLDLFPEGSTDSLLHKATFDDRAFSTIDKLRTGSCSVDGSACAHSSQCANGRCNFARARTSILMGSPGMMLCLVQAEVAFVLLCGYTRHLMMTSSEKVL